jgi:hypothetical protein
MTAMKQAEKYLERFRRATTVEQQRAVAEGYQTFYATLSTTEQKQADEVMRELWLEIDDEVAELERLTQQAQDQLKRTNVMAVGR